MMMDVHRSVALLIVVSAMTLSASAFPVICTPVTIDGVKKGCVINDEVREDAFQKEDNLFDDDEMKTEKTWTKIIIQDGGEPCATSPNKPLQDQRLAAMRSRVPTTNNVHSKSALTFAERMNLGGLGSDEMEGLEKDAGKRSTHEISAILPPWKEFCRMLGRNGCGRYMRRQLSR